MAVKKRSEGSWITLSDEIADTIKGRPAIDIDKLGPAAEHYLRHIGASLYGRPFEIPESMSKAVAFIVETMEGVLNAANELGAK